MSKPARPQPFPTSIQGDGINRPARQVGTKPVAPPVYRPQPAPKVLQRKTVGNQPTPSARPRREPAAPPVYRPRTAPGVLQPKGAAQQTATAPQPKRAPAAPPVYRPQPVPKVLQRKGGCAQPPPTHSPFAPPAYRPQATPKVLQAKGANANGFSTARAGARGANGLRQGGAASGPRAGGLIQLMQHMALPTPPPQAANNYVPNGANISHQTIQPPLRDNVMGTPGPSLQRAFRVEAVVGPQDYDAQGNNPSVEPLGWEWAGLVPTGPAPHQGWVRFHLLNAHLGGPGNREWNLVPTTNYWNSCADWQTNFEEYAKAEVNTNGNVIAFEVEVTYHQNAVHVPQELGDNELEKFPSKIEAQYHVWDAANSRWKTPSKPHSQVELNIPAPPTTAGNVEMLLTDVGESTLTKLYKLDHWLASRIVGSRNKLALAHPATLQDLYDFYCEWIPIYDPGKEPGKWQSRLSSAWTKLEDALLRTQGLSLRIYNGWSPQNNAARAVRLPPEQRREKAQREKLQAAVAERKKKEAEAQKQLRQQESGNLLDSILGAMDKSQKETARYQYGPSSQQKQEKKEKKEGGRFNPY